MDQGVIQSKEKKQQGKMNINDDGKDVILYNVVRGRPS